MKRSITRKLQLWMGGFGIFMGIVFPYYAALFDKAGSWNNPLFRGGSFMAGLMIGVFCYIMVRVILLKEIKKIDAFASSLKDNDLTASISIDSADQIGAIVTNLSESTQSIRTLMTRILTISEAVFNSLNELRQFADNMNSAASEISERSHAMTSTADMISSNSQLITGKVSETAQSVSKITGEITELRELLSDVEQQCAEELTAARDVNNEFVKTQMSIQELSNNSNAISNISEVIMGIADQTNLLAINAAVEAAVAGHYGKSFAVVANEVKILADKSLKSAGEISSLIDTVKPIIESSSDSINRSSEKMKHLTSLAEKISESTTREVQIIGTIERELYSSSDNMQQVKSSVEENNSGITESTDRLRLVNEAINSISRDITEGTKNIQNLEQQAKDLAVMTHRFTLR